jgi:hypothetical protein
LCCVLFCLTLASTSEKKHVILVFVGLVYLTFWDMASLCRPTSLELTILLNAGIIGMHNHTWPNFF